MRELPDKSAASFIVTHECLASTAFDVVFIVWHGKYGQSKAAMRVFAAPFYDTACKDVFQVDIDRDTGTKGEELVSAVPSSHKDEKGLCHGSDG